MERDDIVAFVRRDWARVADAKTEFWRDRKLGLTPEHMLAVGEQLRQHARTVRPDWPSESDRAEDLAVHLRVTGALRAVSKQPR